MVLTKVYCKKCGCAYISCPCAMLLFFPMWKTSLMCIWLSWLKINSKEKKKKFSADSLHTFPALCCWLPKCFVCPLLPMKGSWEYFLYLFHQIMLTALVERVWSLFILPGWSIRQQHRSSPFHVDVPQNYISMLVWSICFVLHPFCKCCSCVFLRQKTA